MVSRFELLPPYVRDQIFEYALDMDPPLSWPGEFEDPILGLGEVGRKGSSENIVLGALALNKFLSAEAVDIFLKTNTFIFNSARCLHEFMTDLARLHGKPFKPTVGEICLNIDTVWGEVDDLSALHEVLGREKFENGLSDVVPGLRSLIVSFKEMTFRWNGQPVAVYADSDAENDRKFKAIVKVLEECVCVPMVQVTGLDSYELASRMEVKMTEPVDKVAYTKFMEGLDGEEAT